MDAPRSFEFSYQALGTDVLDCVLPHRDFDGSVFTDSTLLMTADTPSGAARALRLGDAIYLESTFFATGAVDGDWARIDRSPAIRADLERILGVDLAAYLLADDLPPSGNEVLEATLRETDVASNVESIRPRGGPPAPGYRFIVEAEGTTPVIDAWVDVDGNVVRIRVQDSLPDQAGEPDPDSGWITDYRPTPDTPPPPPPTDVAPVDAASLVVLTPATPAGCELEIGPEPSTPSPQP